MQSRHFLVVTGSWAVVRLGAHEAIPAWADAGPLVSITRTAHELSIVCPEAVVPSEIRCEGGWALIQLQGPFEFSQVGVLASFASPLAKAGVSLFAISTYDTDYLLVRRDQLGAATHALIDAGHVLEDVRSR